MKSSKLASLSEQLIWACVSFFIPFQLFILPGASPSPRLMDGLLVLAPLFLIKLLLERGIRERVNLRLVVVFFAFLSVWLIRDLASGEFSWIVISVRGMLGACFGLVIVLKMETLPLRRIIVFGLSCGAIVSVMVLVLQWRGFYQQTVSLGMAAVAELEDTSVLRTYFRFPGMHGHSNASAAVAGLSIPLVLGFIAERRLGLLWAVFPFAAYGITAALTLTRSPAFAVAGTVLIFVLAAKGSVASRFLRFVAIFGVGLTVGYILYVKYIDRIDDAQNVASNAFFRIETMMASIDLSLRYPFGLGSAAKNALYAEESVFTTHNAWLLLANQGGIFYVLFVLSLYGVGFIRSWKCGDMVSLHLIVFVLIVSQFEEHFMNPVFMVINGMIIGRGLLRPQPSSQRLGRLIKESMHRETNLEISR